MLNGQANPPPDYQLVDAELGDRLLFCSDGLSGMIDDDVIAELVASTSDLDAAVAALTKAAPAAADNITWCSPTSSSMMTNWRRPPRESSVPPRP